MVAQERADVNAVLIHVANKSSSEKILSGAPGNGWRRSVERHQDGHQLHVCSTLTKRMDRFSDAILHNNERGEWISPPPAKERIEHESQQHGSGEIGYTEYGDPRGTPIVLFHGMPGSRLAGKIFDQVAQEQQARLLVADRPGSATSSAVHHGSLPGSVDDVITWADAMHVDTFAVLGVSGDAVCAGMCSEDPLACEVLRADEWHRAASSPPQHGRHGVGKSHLLYAWPVHADRDRCTCVETGESVDGVNAALYRRGQVPTGRCLARGLCAADGQSA